MRNLFGEVKALIYPLAKIKERKMPTNWKYIKSSSKKNSSVRSYADILHTISPTIDRRRGISSIS